MTAKFRAVVTHYGNHQVSPFFATAKEAGNWCETNEVKFDCIMPVANWEEVQTWQENPAYPMHYRGQAWEVAS